VNHWLLKSNDFSELLKPEELTHNQLPQVQQGGSCGSSKGK
jgi:hypothetical protein